MERKLEMTALSTFFIRVAGVLESSPCLLPFLSFQIVDSVVWNTYLSRNKWVEFQVWYVSVEQVFIGLCLTFAYSLILPSKLSIYRRKKNFIAYIQRIHLEYRFGCPHQQMNSLAPSVLTTTQSGNHLVSSTFTCFFFFFFFFCGEC